MARRPTTRSARLAHERAASPPNNGWVTVDRYELPNGKVLEPGVEVAVRGEPGARFRFLSHTRKPNGAEWVTVIGGTPGVVMFRSFRPDRISRVFRNRQLSSSSDRALRPRGRRSAARRG